MRLTCALNLVLLLVLWIASIWAYPQLSEHIPVHFDAAGIPDRWAEPAVLTWFGIPLMASGLAVSIHVLAYLLPSHPAWVNFPRKERFLTLPDHRRLSVIALVQRLLWGSSALVVAVFCTLQLARYRAAQGHSSHELILGILVLAALSTPVLLGIWLPPIQRELDRQLKAEETELSAHAGRA